MAEPRARIGLVLSCEHAGRGVPARYAPLFDFEGADELLESHRGYDAGALELARAYARRFGVELFAHPHTRLLVDLNRSIGNRGLFSEFSLKLPEPERRSLVAELWNPHRVRVEAAVEEALGRFDTVLHLAVHSFTPVRDGVVRQTDVGLLYDPRRPLEKALCAAWKAAMDARGTGFRVRYNYPFKGVSDGFVTLMRKHLGPDRYLGVELEVNQKHFRAGGRAWRELQALVIDGLAAASGL